MVLKTIGFLQLRVTTVFSNAANPAMKNYIQIRILFLKLFETLTIVESPLI